MDANLFKNLIFLDIETVACTPAYQDLPTPMQHFWDKKAASLGSITPQTSRKLFSEKAGIYAEFGKVIVVGLGYITLADDNTPQLYVKGLADHDEQTLLQSLSTVLTSGPQQDAFRLCAHNGKEFDFPYLCRRLLVNDIPLPPVLNTAGKKPWQVNHLDTMEMWKFGDRKSFVSLDLLARLFDIPSSKAEIDGSQVSHCYYVDQNLDKITTYCMRDVVVTAQVFLRLNNQPCVQPEHIIFT